MILAFSRWKFHFGRPRKSFTGFLKVKSKKKKSPQLFFSHFSTLHFSFSSSFFQFVIIFILLFSIFFSFSSTFPIFYLFSLPLFSWLIAKNFPVKSLWGPPAPLPPPVTPLQALVLCFALTALSVNNLKPKRYYATHAEWSQRGHSNTTQPDSHYIRYMAASAEYYTVYSWKTLADVRMVSEVLRVVSRCSVLW